MASRVETYYGVSEKGARFAELYKSLKDRAVFIVPSGLDKDPLLQMISPEGFFGARPVIWTWGELYRELAPEKRLRRVIDPPDHNLIIRHVLSLYLKRMEEEGVELPAGVLHKNFAGILGENLRDLLVEEVPPEFLSDSVSKECGEQGQASPEAVLSALYSAYVGYLEKHKIADNAQIPTLITQLLDDAAVRERAGGYTFILTGFLSFAGGQLKLVKKLSEAADCRFILPYSGIADFHDAIRQLGEELDRLPECRVNVAELRANNLHLQFDSLAREIALWAHGESDFKALGELSDYGDIGIQARPENVPILENALTRYKIPYNVQIRGRVEETLLGALPRAVWNAYSGGWNTKDTAFLLSNPLLGCSGFNAAECMERFPIGAPAWERLLDAGTLEVFRRICALCGDLRRGGAPADILRSWRDFLAGLDIADTAAVSIGGETGLDEAVKDFSSSLAELDKKVEILEDLNKDIGEAARAVFKGAEAVSYIIDWSRTATLPIKLPQSGSATIYAGAPPTLATHRYWIMTDVDYSSWPGRLRESPLLPNESRQRINDEAKAAGREEKEPALHLPDMREEREQKEALFRRLLATGRDGVVVTRSLTDTSGRPMGESQFMRSFYDSRKPSERSPLAVVEYPLSRSLPEAEDVWLPGAEVCGAEPKLDRGEFPRVGRAEAGADEKLVIPLSSIDEWVSCPYRYMCRYRLKLKERRTDIFDQLSAGNFLHRLWELAWGERLDKGVGLVQPVLKYWNAALEERYPELASDDRLRRHAERLKKQVLRLAEAQDGIESALAPLGRERVGLEVPLPEYEVSGVVFRGRADRIDYFRDGAVLLDYKSNEAAKHGGDLQLASYCVILRDKAGLEPLGYGWFGHADASTYGLFSDDGLRAAYRSPRARAGMEDFIARAGAAMADMAASVVKGEYPAVYDSKSCRCCGFYSLCRRREAPRYGMEDEEAGEGANLD